MRHIVLNGVKRELPKLGFKAMNRLGDLGFDLLVMTATLVGGDTTQAGKLQLAAVCHAMGCTVAEAEDYLEEHFDNGGSITSILEPFETALMESEYFLSLLRQAEPEEPEKKPQTETKKTQTKKKTTTEATQS